MDTCINCGTPKGEGSECPVCHCIYERAERIHQRKKQRQQEDHEDMRDRVARGIMASVASAARVETINCQACNLAGGMVRKMAWRFPPFIRFIGAIIAAPSALGMCMAFLVMGLHGQQIEGAIVSTTIGGIIFVLSAAGGLIGWLLLMRRKVWACRRCGHAIDRI